MAFNAVVEKRTDAVPVESREVNQASRVDHVAMAASAQMADEVMAHIYTNHTHPDIFHFNMTAHHHWRIKHNSTHIGVHNRQEASAYWNGDDLIAWQNTVACRRSWGNIWQHTLTYVDDESRWRRPGLWLFDNECVCIGYGEPTRSEISNPWQTTWGYSLWSKMPKAVIINILFWENVELRYNGWFVQIFENVPGIRAGWIAGAQYSNGQKYMRMAFDERDGFHL